MNTSTNKRSVALDLVRGVAVFCVIAVHFFLNSGYYDIPVIGVRMYVMTLLRSSFMVCVPLFLILSGFLLLYKKPTLAYYITIIRTIGVYLLACFFCFIYRILSGADNLNLGGYLSEFLCYHMSNYGWYIEMYMGLFLLIPYINILYHALSTQAQKKYFLLVLLFLTAAPGILNYCEDLPLVPAWWTDLYPVTFFLIGAYLREYPLKLAPATSVVLFLAACIASGTYNFFRSYGQPFIWGTWQDWGSGIHVVQTILLFHTITSINLRNIPPFLANTLAHISDWSLGAYLVSCVFDDAFYSILVNKVPDIPMRFNYFPIMVFSITVCSLVVSGLLHFVYKWTFGILLRRLQQHL